MATALAKFGAAICVACVLIYPKPTLFVLVVLFVLLVLFADPDKKQKDTDDTE